MNIKELLAHESNYSKGRHETIKYIVLHYTANKGDTAWGNCNYSSSANRGKSSHYFVDENEIYRSVRDMNIAWHCGATSYKHKYCRNSNSIGIEMCSDFINGNYVITENTVKNAFELTKYLMEKYNIPIENVLRHYDVTGKVCPEPWVRDESKWIEFKSKLEANEVNEVRYNTIDEVPEWGKEVIQLMIDRGAFADIKKLDLSMDMIRIFEFNRRMGFYK